MKRYSYAERDYTFGQRMLTLRTRLGLTQAGLAALLGVSRRAVSEWESGSNHPTAGHLQHLLELGVQQRIFAPGREEEEIRALWQGGGKLLVWDAHNGEDVRTLTDSCLENTQEKEDKRWDLISTTNLPTNFQRRHAPLRA